MDYKAVIFDMDGVVFDSETIMYKAFQQFVEAKNLPSDFKYYAPLLGKNKVDGRITLSQMYDGRVDYDAFINFASTYKKVHIEKYGLPVKRGFYQLLAYLERHRITVAMVSSSDTSIIEENLKITNLTKRFSMIMGGNRVIHSKPSPEIYLVALDTLNLTAKDVLVIEDSENGIKASVNAQIDTICVPDMMMPDSMLLKRCIATVDSLDKVIPYIH